MTHDLIDVFDAHNSIISCVGAGGKKSIMFRLAEAHTGRVGITATAHIEFFPESLKAKSYIADEQELLEAIKNDRDSNKIAFAKPSARFGRRAGISLDSVKEFKKAGDFDLMVVKADGARGCFIKAPAKHEPAISPDTSIIVPVVSAKVIGLPLSDEIAHRVEHISHVCDLKQGDKIKPLHIARLLSSSSGLLKNTENKKVIPVINMVDDPELEMSARKAAQESLELSDRFDKVVLASMKQKQCIVEVVTS